MKNLYKRAISALLAVTASASNIYAAPTKADADSLLLYLATGENKPAVTDYNGDNKTDITDVIALMKQIDSDDKNRAEKLNKLMSYAMEDDDPSDGSGWNKENTSAFKWSYINGCMISALMDIYKSKIELNDSDADKYLSFSDTYMSHFISSSSTSSKGYINSSASFKISNYTLDDLNSCKALMELNRYTLTNSKKYNLALSSTFLGKGSTLDYIKTNQRTAEGSFWHKKSYPYQVWLDGTYMALPTMLQYEIDNNNSSDIDTVCDDITNQFNIVYTKLRDETTGLYYHGYDAQADKSSKSYNLSKAQSWAKNTDNACSKSFWLRGNAWYIMALIDTIELMPASQTENKATLISIYKQAVDDILKYQDTSTGMWYQVIDNPSNTYSQYNYLETSGSAGLAYAIMKGSNMGILNESYYYRGLKAFNGICDNKLTVSNSAITLKDICGVAGLCNTSSTATAGPKHSSRDGSYEYYVSEKKVENDAKGMAPLIMAYSEIIKHN